MDFITKVHVGSHQNHPSWFSKPLHHHRSGVLVPGRLKHLFQPYTGDGRNDEATLHFFRRTDLGAGPCWTGTQETLETEGKYNMTLIPRGIREYTMS